jgi:hypothetical protein
MPGLVGGRPGFEGARGPFSGQRFLGLAAGGAFMRSVGWGGYGGGWGWNSYSWGGRGWPGYGWGPGIAGLAPGLGLASAYYAYPPMAFRYPYYASPFYGDAYPPYGWGGYGWGGYGCCGWGGNDWALGLAGLALGLGLISPFPGYSPLAYSYPYYASPLFGAPRPLYDYGLPVAYAPPPVYGFGPVYGYGYDSVAYDVSPVAAVPYGLPLW